jgi:hypothetical protein
MHTYHRVVGSVPVSLVRHAKYPVLVVPWARRYFQVRETLLPVQVTRLLVVSPIELVVDPVRIRVVQVESPRLYGE